MTTFVNFTEFDATRIVTPEKPEQTATRFSSEKIKLNADEIKILYDYTTKTKDGKTLTNRGPLRVKFPAVTSNQGVVYKDFSGGTKPPNPSVYVKFDVKNNEEHEFVVGHPSSQYRDMGNDDDGNPIDEDAYGVLGSIYTWCCDQLYNYKKYQKGNSKFSRDSVSEVLPEKLILRRPQYTDKDGKPELVGREKPDVDPGKFFKITTFNTPGTPDYREAPFVSPSGKIFKLRDLQNKNLKFIPVVLFRHIWLGEKYSITSEITEALIVDIGASSGLNPRLDVLRTSWLEGQDSAYDERSVDEAFAKIRAIEAATAAEEASSDGGPPAAKVRVITLDPEDPDYPSGSPEGDDVDSVPPPRAKKSSILSKLQGVSGGKSIQ